MKVFFKRFSNVIYPVIGLLTVLALWAILASIVGVDLIIPSIKDTFSSLGILLSNSTFYLAVLNTLWRTLLTFAIALICGVLFAIMGAVLPIFAKIFTPIMRFLRAVPTISVILLIIVWLDPVWAPILVTLLIVFPICYSNMYDVIVGINKDYLTLCKTYQISKGDAVKSLYIPYVLPTFFDTARATISLTIKVVISAEVMAQTKGSMGIMMQIAKASLETADLLAWTICAIVLSYFLEFVVALIKKSVVRWEK